MVYPVYAMAETPFFTAETAIDVARPPRQRVPVVFASPHSGRTYPPDLLALSRLEPRSLRQSEDAFVDELFADVVDLGAPLLSARFPRVYVDANREAMELDPAMFDEPLPEDANIRSPRVAAGIGTIARIVCSGQEIYHKPLRLAEAWQRISSCYAPYHRMLKSLVDDTMDQFGICLVVDCHSMPSGTGQAGLPGPTSHRADIVLGDCWGSTCDSATVQAAERAALAMGYSVRRNSPYAGGFTTRQYGSLGSGLHALQIEIDRSLYMDERLITRLPVFGVVKARMTQLAQALAEFGAARLAAE